MNVTIRAKGPLTNGTEVLVDGTKMKGLTKVELVGQANDAWRAVLHVIPQTVEFTDIDSVSVRHAFTGSEVQLAPQFDAMGRTGDEYIATQLAEHAEALAVRNSTFGELFYFGDVTPPSEPAYGFEQWRLNVQSMHIATKHNQAFVFARNGAGQWEANEAMLPQFGHARTATFPTREAARAHFDVWLARELELDPNATGGDLPFAPGEKP